MKDTYKEGAKDGPKDTLPPSLPPSNGGSPAVAVAFAVARTTTTTTRQGRAKNRAPGHQTTPFTPAQWQELREAVIALHGDRKLPPRWSVRNDLSIVKQMAKRWGFADILAMIEGLNVLRANGDVSWIHPREAVTLRALRKMSGVESVDRKALAAGYKARESKPAPAAKGEKRHPAALASLIAGVMPR